VISALRNNIGNDLSTFYENVPRLICLHISNVVRKYIVMHFPVNSCHYHSMT